MSNDTSVSLVSQCRKLFFFLCISLVSIPCSYPQVSNAMKPRREQWKENENCLCIVHTAHSTQQIAHSTLHTAHCSVHTAHCAHRLCDTAHSTMCTLHTVYIAHSTLHTAQCTQHNVHTVVCADVDFDLAKWRLRMADFVLLLQNLSFKVKTRRNCTFLSFCLDGWVYEWFQIDE